MPNELAVAIVFSLSKDETKKRTKTMLIVAEDTTFALRGMGKFTMIQSILGFKENRLAIQL